tara:strand:+ start:377 stop:532 length:156 start_codon:yes stop_codon:yes gene_type:complete
MEKINIIKIDHCLTCKNLPLGEIKQQQEAFNEHCVGCSIQPYEQKTEIMHD